MHCVTCARCAVRRQHLRRRIPSGSCRYPRLTPPDHYLAPCHRRHRHRRRRRRRRRRRPRVAKCCPSRACAWSLTVAIRWPSRRTGSPADGLRAARAADYRRHRRPPSSPPSMEPTATKSWAERSACGAALPAVPAPQPRDSARWLCLGGRSP